MFFPPMKTDLTLDLKVARRKAGLTHSDCAHLLSLDRSSVSRLERGERLPSLEEACRLALIYNRPLDSLVVALKHQAAHDLGGRLSSLPKPPTKWISTFNRQHTLSSLAERLIKSEPGEYGQL